MRRMLTVILIAFLVNGCVTAPVNDNIPIVDEYVVSEPRIYSEKEAEDLLMAKANVDYDIRDYCEPQFETTSFLDGFAERCDYQNGINYYVLDGFYIYDINAEDLSYTIREKQLVFPLMRENQVYGYYHAYTGGAKIANDGIDVLTQVFNDNENFALIATGGSAWLITETNQYLFQESYLGSTEISDEIVSHVRKTILKEQKASFYRHKIVPEEVAAELEVYEQKRQEAERNFQFPLGTVQMKDLFQEDIYDMSFTVFAMEGNTYVMNFSNEKMNEILNELGSLELTTDFEKEHGAGGERIELRLASDNGWALTYTERTDEMTIEAVKDNKKMTYALTDSKLREKGILLPLMESMLEGSQKRLSNGTYDIPLITARFYKDGYTVSGELGAYSYPYSTIRDIDFSEFTIYCDGYQVEEISTEPGEHILNLLVNDNEEYILKYFVD